MKTAVIIPCFNESESVPQLCGRLRQLFASLSQSWESEFIFVDDGSTDGTAKTIAQYADGIPYRLISHSQNLGITAAIKSGIAATSALEIVTIDSDCTYDPAKAVDLLAKLRQGYDVVTGSPYHPDGLVVGVPKWRLFLSKTLSRAYWVVLPQHLYTYSCCFRAYRREALPSLVTENDGFLGITQMLGSALLQGLRVAEVPATLTTRKFGQSKIKVVRVVLAHIGYLCKVVGLRVKAFGSSPKMLIPPPLKKAS